MNGVLGQIVGGWTMTGIHNYRSGGTITISDGRMNNPGNTGFPFRPDIVQGVDPIIFDGSHLDSVRGTPSLTPRRLRPQPLVAAGGAVATLARRRWSSTRAVRCSYPRTWA